MNQGYLRMTVLELLSREPCSGYSLVKTIHAKTGWKPSYGSIYPLLDRLDNEGLVTIEENGRSKIYALTPAGKKIALNEKEARTHAHNAIIEQLTVLASMGDEHAGEAATMLKNAEAGECLPEMKEMVELRREIFRVLRDGLDKTQREKLKIIFSETTRELKRVK
jgi:DNA-binding PadR family transcriptional regulator